MAWLNLKLPLMKTLEGTKHLTGQTLNGTVTLTHRHSNAPYVYALTGSALGFVRL